MMRYGFTRLDVGFANASFRRDLESPRENQRYWETRNRDQHNQPHRPVRNFKERKNLGRDLNEQPRNNCVRDGDLVNIAPLQLGEEIALAHSDVGKPIFSSMPL